MHITENSFKEFCYKRKKRNGDINQRRSRVNKDIFQDGRITAIFYANESDTTGIKKYPEDRGRCCSNIFEELREGGYAQVTGLVLAKSLDRRRGRVNWYSSRQICTDGSGGIQKPSSHGFSFLSEEKEGHLRVRTWKSVEV